MLWVKRIVGCAMVLIATVATVSAQATDRFTATTVNMDPAGEDLAIDLLRWSTDEDRRAVLDVIMNHATEDGEDAELSELIDLPTLGYVWPSSSGLGYSLKYAHRIEMSDGGEHITLVTNRRLGTYGRAPWKPTDMTDTLSIRPFTVIELRLDSTGKGEGKFSAATDIVFDMKSGTVALEDYDASPVLLESVSRRAQPYSGR